MEIKIDAREFEKQRRDEIKKSDKYLEFNVIINAEPGKDMFSAPVVLTELHNCGSAEIAKLCAILFSELETLADEYPEEFAYATFNMKVKNVKTSDDLINLDLDEEEKSDERPKEN